VILTFSKPMMALDGTPDATEVNLSFGTVGTVTISGTQMTVGLSGVPDGKCLTISALGGAHGPGGERIGR